MFSMLVPNQEFVCKRIRLPKEIIAKQNDFVYATLQEERQLSLRVPNQVEENKQSESFSSVEPEEAKIEPLQERSGQEMNSSQVD